MSVSRRFYLGETHWVLASHRWLFLRVLAPSPSLQKFKNGNGQVFNFSVICACHPLFIYTS